MYECALNTSNHMFGMIKPGMAMEDVDREARRYNAGLLKDAGVLKDVEEIGTYMWHGGSHHVGYDVHDVVERPRFIAPGMVFCVDIGIYHEEWGFVSDGLGASLFKPAVCTGYRTEARRRYKCGQLFLLASST